MSFCIYPDGNIVLIGAYDKLESRKFVSGGFLFPQTSLPNMNLQMLAISIGNVLYQKDVIGNISVDLVAFPDETGKSGHPLFWAVDLDCCVSDSAAVMSFFDFLMEGTLDPVTGFYHLNSAEEEKNPRFFFLFALYSPPWTWKSVV